MGLTHLKATIANPANPRRMARLTFLIDSGAIYSVVPGNTLRRLGIKAHSTCTFTHAYGTEIKRRIGDTLFLIYGKKGSSPIIFGKKGDSALLGSVSLEALGLMLDPIQRVLRPLPMSLG